jgi:hypothetical protein
MLILVWLGRDRPDHIRAGAWLIVSWNTSGRA